MWFPACLTGELTEKRSKLQKGTASGSPCLLIPARLGNLPANNKPRRDSVLSSVKWGEGTNWAWSAELFLGLNYISQLRYLAHRLIHGKHPITTDYYLIIIQHRKELVAVKRRKGPKMVLAPNCTPSWPSPPFLPCTLYRPGLTTCLLVSSQLSSCLQQWPDQTKRRVSVAARRLDLKAEGLCPNLLLLLRNCEGSRKLLCFLEAQSPHP